MQVVRRTRLAPGFAGHIDREAKILSGSHDAWDAAHVGSPPRDLVRVGAGPTGEAANNDAESDQPVAA
jgi:hypothetical protein